MKEKQLLKQQITAKYLWVRGTTKSYSFACLTKWRSYLILGALILTMLSMGANAEITNARHVYTGKVRMDISKVPFSRFGSYMSISDMKDFPATSKRDFYGERALGPCARRYTVMAEP